jgi:dTDP-4-dehydrorhamnose reductase
VETVVGANLAAYLADQVDGAQVVGLSSDTAMRLEGCSVHVADVRSREAAARWVESAGAEQVILCGAAARSHWESQGAGIDESCVEQAAVWAEACQEAGCRFTLISSDAVFTGPWMFHEEESPGACTTHEAACIREAERTALELCPETLVIRTNAFGWSPLGDREGWIEQRLLEVRARRLTDQDCIRHATPILATDLAGILVRGWSENLGGVHHVAGAERVSPLKFVQRLADQFDLPWLSIERGEALTERAEGFGAGECSLQTKRLRKALCVAMPMLSEGLSRLAEQDRNGFRARLAGQDKPRNERAA